MHIVPFRKGTASKTLKAPNAVELSVEFSNVGWNLKVFEVLSKSPEISAV